jgi:hypothetical protein
MSQATINGWALAWDADETPRAPALPVRSLEDELVPPGKYVDLAAQIKQQTKEQMRHRQEQARNAARRNAERRAEARRAIMLMKLQHI